MKDSNSKGQPEYGPRLRRREVARYLGSAEQTLARWFCEGIGPPAYRISSRAVVYDRRELDEWLKERRAASSAEAFEKAEKRERAQKNEAPAEGALPRKRKRGRPPRSTSALHSPLK
jgi:predicted DNA-binding transcriptional regulator AlpA